MIPMGSPDLLSISLAVIAIILATYHYLFRGLNFFKHHGIHHRTPLPIFGNMAGIIFRTTPIAALISHIYNAHPDAKYVGMFDFMTPVIVIRDTELIKSVAIKHSESFPDHRGFVNPDTDPMMGNNLASLKGDKWKNVRTAVTPVFTSSKIKMMFKLMTSYAESFSEFLARLPESEREMDVRDAFTRYANDIVASCAFGVSVDSMRDRHNDFYEFGLKATVFTGMRMTKAFIVRSMPSVARLLGMKIIDEPVASFFKSVVERTIKSRDELGISRPDMIQILMDTRGKRGGEKELSVEEITSQAFIFFFGGFDTVSTLMSFVTYHLVVHPDVQTRLRQEIDDALDDAEGFTYEVILKMRYLDAVINEVLRVYPLAAILDRVASKDFELPPALPGAKPFTVKAGMPVWFPVFPLHHDAKYFEDPEKFDPDRFLNKEREIQSTGAYLPFGLGPRVCIGVRFAMIETKVLLCHLLARCELVRSSKTCEPLKLAKLGFFTMAENGYWMTILPRDRD